MRTDRTEPTVMSDLAVDRGHTGAMNRPGSPPAMFFVGVGKCGTSWLYDFLGKSGVVDVPEIKEPYLVDLSARERRRAMRRLFADDGRPKADFSNLYYWDATNPEAIRAWNPEARAIVTVRRPSDRAVSHFRFLRRNSIVSEATFGEYVQDGDSHEVIGRSDYRAIITRYQNALGTDRVLVLPLELLRSDPGAYVKRLAQFLELDLPEPSEEDAAPVLAAQEARVQLAAKLAWRFGVVLRRLGLLRILAALKRSRIVQTVLFRPPSGPPPQTEKLPARLKELDDDYPVLLGEHGIELGPTPFALAEPA